LGIGVGSALVTHPEKKDSDGVCLRSHHRSASIRFHVVAGSHRQPSPI